MRTPVWLENLVLNSLDAVYSRVPQPWPEAERFRRARVIAHRGEHHAHRENTLAAFRRARLSGCWGIELDVQWTSDRLPVVSHDPSTKRVFGTNYSIPDLTRKELRMVQPEIPWLEEVLEEFAGPMHLLIELKKGIQPSDCDTLQSVLRAAEPERDYHLISMEPDLFAAAPFVPANACLPIATTNASALAARLPSSGWGGLLAPYALCPNSVVFQVRQMELIIGTGFVDCENVLKRELNRGVQWLFSNNPALTVKISSGLCTPARAESFAHQIKHYGPEQEATYSQLDLLKVL